MHKASFTATQNALLAAAIFLSFPVMAGEVPGHIARDVPHAEKVGSGRMRYLTFDVYDASLYAQNGKVSPDSGPLALSLTYLRNLDGQKIADRSVEEMRKQGFSDEARLNSWHMQMSRIFPDVQKGTNLTGVLAESGKTSFYHDGHHIGSIVDPGFGPRFFGIWLSPQTSDTSLRAQLLNR